MLCDDYNYHWYLYFNGHHLHLNSTNLIWTLEIFWYVITFCSTLRNNPRTMFHSICFPRALWDVDKGTLDFVWNNEKHFRIPFVYSRITNDFDTMRKHRVPSDTSFIHFNCICFGHSRDCLVLKYRIARWYVLYMNLFNHFLKVSWTRVAHIMMEFLPPNP